MTTTDFQEATAQRILHMFKDMRKRRILLADEVGLGKTMVARRVIELVKKWHEEQKDDFFKVVYICSNISIADQNIAKLGVDNKMNVSESRLSMQHLFITLKNREICDKAKEDGKMPESIIPLTPSTSFRLTNSLGTANERAVMFDILKHDSRLEGCEAELSRFFSQDVKSWDVLVSWYDEKIDSCVDCNINGSSLGYLEYMLARLKECITDEESERLKDCALNKKCTWNEKSGIINVVRRAFATISIDMLDPDLVIMDEFQRFSDLLREDGENEQSMLVHKFFDATRTNTKVLLLSATPYKPYSTLEEINEDGKDEHYGDFMKVMDFLFVDKNDAKDFQTKWQRYSAALKRTDIKDLTPLAIAKNDAQDALYGVMCRTERFNSGILDDSHVTDVDVLPEDIVSYAQGQNLLKQLKVGNLPIEYVKSSPYLLSFMDRYVLKQKVEKELRKNNIITELPTETLLLSKYRINNYYDIVPSNGKLKYLHDLVFGEEHNKIGEEHNKKVQHLLWVPASHPYYKAGGIFESEEAKRFSKIILFSSWEMVPRMVSCMMSYYSELYTLGEIKKKQPEIRYTVPDKKNRYGENRLRAGNLLEYPCRTLAELYVPKEYYGQKIVDIRKRVSSKIKSLFSANKQISALLPQQRSNASHILAIMKMLDDCYEDDDAVQIRIPANALDVLTDIAIASPAVCAYRQSHSQEDARQAAKALVSIFNKPESAAVIDFLYNKKGDDDYYESVLEYCVKGNLQSVLDEYAHMLNSNKIGKALEESILGTTILKVDTKESIGNEDKKISMRTHFAIPFVDKTLTDKTIARTSNIRNAFNSPFRPFILSSTSIGQEGLDFHWYARKIVHWNLPSNPVDLEQREGRINRYKCLAVRRNVAKLYGDVFSWNEMFAKAKAELKGADSEMVPYWCLPVNKLSDEQKQKLEYIERIVPLYPLSRDCYRYEQLVKVLSLYRMTLGQPRQEELLELLKGLKLSEEQLDSLTIDLCPFYKKHNTNRCFKYHQQRG